MPKYLRIKIIRDITMTGKITVFSVGSISKLFIFFIFLHIVQAIIDVEAKVATAAPVIPNFGIKKKFNITFIITPNIFAATNFFC